MDSKDKLRQMIHEELEKFLEEQARDWWKKPAEAESAEGFLKPSDVHEESKKRPSVGKSSKGKYVSAGTIGGKGGKKLKDAQTQNREAIGAKMLNTFRRGGEAGKQFREKINKQLKNKDKPTDRLHQYSQIWANASMIAANGGTAASVNVDKKDTPDKKSKKSPGKKKS